MFEPTTEPVVFSNTFESVFHRALKGKLSDGAKKELAAMGLSVEGKLMPAYPYAVWVKGLEIATRDVWPTRSLRDGLFELGQALITNYQQTFIGMALFTALRVFPARRVISRMTRSFRTANNYTQVHEREVTPKHLELTFNLVEPTAGLTEGILAAGLPLAGVTTWKVRLESLVGDRAVFSLIES